MPVKNVSHGAEGEVLVRVPVKYKVSLGYPKGYKIKPNSKPLPAPQKLFHFLIQSRNENGEWEHDEALARRVLGDRIDKPTEIPIQLVGNSIEDMVLSDLFYWDESVGAKCNCGTVKTYLQQWCEDNDVVWKLPLSEVRSESELRLLLEEKKVSKRVSEFIDISEKLIAYYKGKMEEWGEYDLTLTDMIDASLARRRIKNEYKSFPCAFRKCPDYAQGKCKYNGRFFFVFDGNDVGDIATLVTTSPRNIRNIQWGLENIIGKVLKGQKGKKSSMHGISCRLVGTPERGTYTNQGTGKQASTKFFIVSLKGPKDKMVESAAAILKQAHEMAKLYPSGMRVEFEEGDMIALARERNNEFTDETSELKRAIVGEMHENEDQFEVFDEHKKNKPQKPTNGRVKDKLLKMASNIEDDELIYMIGVMGKVLDDLHHSNGRNALARSLERSIKKGEITVDKILRAQSYISNLGSKIDLEREWKKYQSHKKKEKIDG